MSSGYSSGVMAPSPTARHPQQDGVTDVSWPHVVWDRVGLDTAMGLGARCGWRRISAARYHRCIQHQEGMERGVCAVTEPPHACMYVHGGTNSRRASLCGAAPLLWAWVCSNVLYPPPGLAGCSVPCSHTWNLGVCCARGTQGTQGSVRLRQTVVRRVIKVLEQ